MRPRDSIDRRLWGLSALADRAGHGQSVAGTNVVPASAVEKIRSRTAVEVVVAILPEQGIVAVLAVEGVVTLPTPQAITPVAAQKVVVVVATGQGVIPDAARQRVGPLASEQDIVSRVSVDLVDAVAAVKESLPFPPEMVSWPAPPKIRSSPS